MSIKGLIRRLLGKGVVSIPVTPKYQEREAVIEPQVREGAVRIPVPRAITPGEVWR